jgi:hypothetical protein
MHRRQQCQQLTLGSLQWYARSVLGTRAEVIVLKALLDLKNRRRNGIVRIATSEELGSNLFNGTLPRDYRPLLPG